MDTKSLMIVGVGGQGTLLASKVMGALLLKAEYDVKVSEVHGMSQRGGSVVTYVRWGSAVHSPIIDRGEADYILAFEQLEAARYLPFLRPGGLVVTNVDKIAPMPVITGAVSYPEGLLEALAQKGARVFSCDALELATRAGNARAVNMVLMGLLARRLDFAEELWEEAIRETVPPRFVTENLSAFRLGRAQGTAKNQGIPPVGHGM